MSRVIVNRAVLPTYPECADEDWLHAPDFKALEHSGPAIYNLSDLELWYHEQQKAPGSSVSGQIVYNTLLYHSWHKRSLGLVDGLAIQTLGAEVYARYFPGLLIPLWRSVVLDKVGRLLVPKLIGPIGGVVLLLWCAIDLEWNKKMPAPLFSETPIPTS